MLSCMIKGTGCYLLQDAYTHIVNSQSSSSVDSRLGPLLPAPRGVELKLWPSLHLWQWATPSLSVADKAVVDRFLDRWAAGKAVCSGWGC